MGIDHYDCCICNDNGIYEGAIYHFEYCGHHICIQCYEKNNEYGEKVEEDLIRNDCPECLENKKNREVVDEIKRISRMRIHTDEWCDALNDLFKKIN